MNNIKKLKEVKDFMKICSYQCLNKNSEKMYLIAIECIDEKIIRMEKTNE